MKKITQQKKDKQNCPRASVGLIKNIKHSDTPFLMIQLSIFASFQRQLIISWMENQSINVEKMRTIFKALG